MKKIKLSIIVPVYNVERYIKKCIGSLLVDGCENYEIIVVNDGTKDRSIEVVRDNFNDHRIRILEQKNDGLSAARNHGIAEAQGEYIWCVDSDDWVETAEIPKIIDLLDRKLDALYFGSHYRDYESEDASKVIVLKNDVATGTELACTPFFHPVQNYVMRKKMLEDNNLHFTNGILHEDSLFTPIMITHCKRVLRFKMPVYHHLQRGGSITHTVSPKRINDMIFVIKKLVSYGDSLPEDIRWKWGRCIAQITNSVLLNSKECEDKNTKQKLKVFLNHNKEVISYLSHSGGNNRVMALLATLMGGRLYQAYEILSRIRY